VKFREVTALGAVLGLAGCLGNPVTACTTDDECNDAFGFGQTCGDSGYCEAATFPARCTQSEPPDVMTNPAAYDRDFVLVGMYDASYDSAEEQSAKLAIKQVNEAGGLDGNTVGFIECNYEENTSIDDLDYPGAITEIAQFMSGRLGVQGFVGPYTSGQTEAWYNATVDDDPRPFVISGAATSPALTYIDGITHTDADPGTVWRTIPPDSLQGQVAANDMWERGRRTVAVVYQTGPYGEGLAQIFTEQFSAKGGDVTGLQFDTSADLAAHIATLADDDTIEEVFMISGEAADVADFVNGAAISGGFLGADYPNDGKGIFLADAAADTDMLAALTSDGEDLIPQIRGTRPAVPDNTLYDTFKIAYQSEYGSDPEATVYMPFAYDAGWLALYATAWSHYQTAAVTGKGMGAGMRNVSDGGTVDVNLLPTGWTTGQSAFEVARAIDVTGTSGPLDYDPDTEETATNIEVWGVNAGHDNFDVIDCWKPDGTDTGGVCN
jgi:branched-chain amino acid transport system substrate-binding protein